jgi:hypothetical protein
VGHCVTPGRAPALCSLPMKQQHELDKELMNRRQVVYIQLLFSSVGAAGQAAQGVTMKRQSTYWCLRGLCATVGWLAASSICL